MATEWCKKFAKTPVIVKLTPNVTNVLPPAKAAWDGGADAVSLINTVNSIMRVNYDTLTMYPTTDGRGSHGGYCGPAVKPIALHMVAEIARNKETSVIPISGIGGVSDWRDAVDFLALGASNVQVCTAAMVYGFDRLVVDDRPAFRDPALFPEGTAFADLTLTAVPLAESGDDGGGENDGGEHLAPYAGREIYAAVVSRCWETDRAALTTLLRSAPPGLRYLGLMGSRRKIDRVVAEVEAAGLALDGVALRAPIGLPLGGDTPGEIAIAILAEILETRYRKAA
jgi:xanthine/CO dehydrogenase XdhC/CoxF family maturation factor